MEGVCLGRLANNYDRESDSEGDRSATATDSIEHKYRKIVKPSTPRQNDLLSLKYFSEEMATQPL